MDYLKNIYTIKFAYNNDNFEILLKNWYGLIIRIICSVYENHTKCSHPDDIK